MTASLPCQTRRMLIAGIGASLALLTGAPLSAQGNAPGLATTLTVGRGKRRLRPEPSPETDVLTYNGGTPGPAIRAKRGETIAITVENGLDQPTSFHISGYRGPNGVDGVAGLTGDAIPPGGRQTLSLTPTDAGTYLYHPLVPGRTAEQVERGLSGMFIVEEEDWQAEIDADVALLLDDWKLSPQAEIINDFNVPADAARAGRLGNALTVNGGPAPQVMTLRPGARVRLRIGGIMNARILPMRFEKMARATVIAVDGQPCEPFDPLRRQVIVAPGSRYDVILDLPRESGAETLVFVSLGDGIPVMRLVTAGEPVAAKAGVPPLPGNLLPPAIRLQEARRAELRIEGGFMPPEGFVDGPAGTAAINRAFPDNSRIFTLNFGFPSGFSGRPLLSVRKGHVVVIAITNRTNWVQTIRVHGHAFRVLHALDDGWEPYFLDTVIVPPTRTVRIAFIAENVGKWAIRSTILEHMDAGVLTWFEVGV
jgi:FtsP/CotA-like multicopper oxidase with cupredoxin domain